MTDQPFATGDRVCLKVAPTATFEVISVQADTQKLKDSTHLNPVGEQSRQHYYRLKTENGKYAYWWHSQLSLIPQEPT